MKKFSEKRVGDKTITERRKKLQKGEETGVKGTQETEMEEWRGGRK